MDRAATEEAAGEARAKAAEAISGRRGSGGSEAWVACCYYCTEEISGWCSSLAFVGSGGAGTGATECVDWRAIGDGLGLSVSVTNWDFAFFFWLSKF